MSEPKYQWVPVEPTHSMISAGMDVPKENELPYSGFLPNAARVARVFRAMLAAAPSPPQDPASHRANEWADAAVNGLQWLRNIRDGVSGVDEAILEMESNVTRCRKLTASPPKDPRDELTWCMEAAKKEGQNGDAG